MLNRHYSLENRYAYRCLAQADFHCLLKQKKKKKSQKQDPLILHGLAPRV